jgi:hypothetical protein
MSFNCNCCGRFGHWSKTCPVPYEEVFNIHARQQTNLVEERNDQEIKEANDYFEDT